MAEIRRIEERDIEWIAEAEIAISKISFGEEAVIDKDFHIKKIRKAMEKDSSGMMVAEQRDKAVGWLWMEKKSNFITNECYVNFKSFYIAEEIRGSEIVDQLMERGVQYAKSVGAEHIVGKVHVKNLPMRSVYKNNGFEPTHITMERKLEG